MDQSWNPQGNRNFFIQWKEQRINGPQIEFNY
jgi:hypothetical protein